MPTDHSKADSSKSGILKDYAQKGGAWLFSQPAGIVLHALTLAAICAGMYFAVPYVVTSQEKALDRILGVWQLDRDRSDAYLEKVVSSFNADQERDAAARTELRALINIQQQQIQTINEMVRQRNDSQERGGN